MGKNSKNKDDAPNPHAVSNRDVIQRLNFLYQASAYLQGITEPQKAAPSSSSSPQNRPMKEPRRRAVSAAELSQSYARNLRSVAQKTTVKIDPTVKRTLCHGCDTVLIVGSTAKVRTKASRSHGHAVTYTCLQCGSTLRIPAPPVAPAPTPRTPTSTEDMTELPPLPGPSNLSETRPKRKRKRPPLPRPPPLFDREDAGHVVFRGLERIPEDAG